MARFFKMHLWTVEIRCMHWLIVEAFNTQLKTCEWVVEFTYLCCENWGFWYIWLCFMLCIWKTLLVFDFVKVGWHGVVVLTWRRNNLLYKTNSGDECINFEHQIIHSSILLCLLLHHKLEMKKSLTLIKTLSERVIIK